jgi:hypothetical protein
MNREKAIMNKVRISFLLPDTLQKDVIEQMVKEGYDLKGKSRWVSEAIERLLLLSAYPELVKLNDEMKGFEKTDSVSISRDLKSQLDQAVMEVRKSYPLLEGVQSRILRTAIVQRLLRG